MGQQQRSRGWRIVSFAWLKNPPEAFAGLIYLFAFLLIVLTIGAGLITFVRLSFEIVFGDWGSLLQTKGVGSGGSPLTVFFAALAALIGGPTVIWRVFTAHVQAQAAHHQADTAREGHYTDLFTKAVEQLGATREVKKTIEVEKVPQGAPPHSVIKERELVTETEPNLEVRLGAIYALDRIARDSERDHWPIMEVLCAYIRNPQNCGKPKPFPDGFYDIKPPRVDIQAALTVVGQRPPGRIAFEGERSLKLDLSGANLQRAHFSNGMFESANLLEAHLERAQLYRAHLKGADLRYAHLEVSFLRETHLEGAQLSEAHLERAHLWETHLENARLYEAHLEGAFINAHLEGASLAGAHLEGAQFVKVHLEGARLFDTDLSKVVDLDPDSLASALGDATTKLPEGMARPATWPDRELDPMERGTWDED